MNSRIPIALVMAFCLQGQSVLEDPVVAKAGNRTLRASDIKKMSAGATPQIQQALTQQPQAALEYLLLIDRLNQEAEKDKLLEMSPWKEQLEFSRREITARTELAYRTNAFTVSEEEQRARYEADKDNYQQAKVRVIYVSFVPEGAPAKAKDGQPAATEQQALAKAEAVAKEARSGADFAALARQHSEDKTSAEKGGEFGVIRRSDKINEDMKKAVFSLKPGEIAGPVKQPNGFYVIKLDELTHQTFDEIRREQWEQLKQEKFQAWLKSIQDANKVTIENPEFFKTGKAGN